MNIIVFQAAEWGQPLVATDERAVHIREILKPEVGQTLRVAALGQGSGIARFLGVDNGFLHLDFPLLTELLPAKPPLPITIILGHPRPPVMQRLLKDLNATGVAQIFVVAADLSEKSYMQSRLWQQNSTGKLGCRDFLVQGAQQGGQAFLSRLRRFYSVNRAVDACELGQFSDQQDSSELGAVWEPPTIAESGLNIPQTAVESTRLLLDIDQSAVSLLDFAATLAGSLQAGNAKPTPSIVVAIGPERGWSDRERTLLHSRGFQALSLGSSILRTETACMVTCSILAMAIDHGH